MSFAYAGIGARTTPMEVLAVMEFYGRTMANRDWVLRSGGADGADLAFESGARKHRATDEMNDPAFRDHFDDIQIYLPWEGFNGNTSPLFNIPDEAFEIAYQNHPRAAWLRRSKNVSRLMARNVLQILGPNLNDPVKMVICWTPDGCEDGRKTTAATGGTGLAIRLAYDHDIPIVNLFGIKRRGDDASLEAIKRIHRIALVATVLEF